jgi:DNA-binding transcriptional regulator YdaS (Cro superfamily)
MKKRRGKGRSEENAVARAVALVGGPTRAARLCDVSNAAVHYWIKSGKVHLLRHALRLSRASGIPIEEFVGDQEDQN